MDIPYFVYSFIQCWILRLVLPFGYCGQCYSEHGVQTICSASVLAFLSSVYPEIELLSYTVILFNFLQNYHTYFLQYLHHFIYPPVVYSSFQFSIFASTCPVSVFFFFNNFIYLFLAVLGLHCCAGFSPVAARGRATLSLVLRLLVAVIAVADHKRSVGFSSCSSWTLEHRINSWGTWA